MNMEFSNNGKIYTAETIAKNFVSDGLRLPLIMLRIINSDNEVIGCVKFTQYLLLHTVWENAGKSEFDEEQKIIYCISLLNGLPFYPDKLRELYEKYGCSCFEYFINSDREGLSVDERTYYIKVTDSFKKTGQKILFGIEITEKKVRKAIMISLNNHWKNDQDTFVLIKHLQALIPVDDAMLIRNLKHLEEDEKVQLLHEPADNTKIISAKIALKGRKEIDEEIESSGLPDVKYFHLGDNINASSSGSSSPIIVKSQDVAVTYSILDKLKTEIDEKYKGEDRETVLQEVAEVKKLAPDPKNKSAINAKLGGLLAKTAQFATIANLIIQALKLHAGI